MVSVSARLRSALGASHWRPYQRRIRSRAFGSEILSGSSDSGRNAGSDSSYGSSCAEPQNSQLRPTLPASNTETARQLWQRTEVFSAFQPCSPGSLFSAATRSCSTTTVASVRSGSWNGDSVPQNGQISACFVGFQFASAPHAGQANFSRASATSRGGGAGTGSFTLRQEGGELRARHAPLGADLLAFQIAGFEAGDDVGFGDAEHL